MSLKRSGSLPRYTRLAPRNAKRRQTEFARCYGSKARVEWVRSLPCVCCLALSPFIAMATLPSDNAHTENGGKGRKGPYQSIAPLCRNHHRRYDQHRPPFDSPVLREAVKEAAAAVEAKWQATQGEQP